jgi:hypothetical protein
LTSVGFTILILRLCDGAIDRFWDMNLEFEDWIEEVLEEGCEEGCELMLEDVLGVRAFFLYQEELSSVMDRFVERMSPIEEFFEV